MNKSPLTMEMITELSSGFTKERTIVGAYEDEYGELRAIYKKGRRLQVANSGTTLGREIASGIAPLIGSKIKAARTVAGMSQRELGLRAGLSGDGKFVKHRIHAIENGVHTGKARYGVRLCTLYAIANALNVSIAQLLPTTEEAIQSANVRVEATPILKVGAA